MKAYKVSSPKIGATRYEDVFKRARIIYRSIEGRTKRQPYVRSMYFDKEKIFLNYFWKHLEQKSYIQRRRRLRLLPCAIELMEKSHYLPISKENPNKKGEVLHRFVGITGSDELFYVQIKEDLRSGRKYFMSVFNPK